MDYTGDHHRPNGDLFWVYIQNDGRYYWNDLETCNFCHVGPFETSESAYNNAIQCKPQIKMEK